MADRVSASITLGGKVTPAQFAQLCPLFGQNDLRMDWDGEPFAPSLIFPGAPLRLCAHETPWGVFDELEQYCCDQRIPYLRWSGSCPGSFGAERIVYDGKSGPLNFSVDEDDHLVLHAQTIAQLGSMRAIRRYIAEAEIELPPFEIVGGVPPPGCVLAANPARHRRAGLEQRAGSHHPVSDRAPSGWAGTAIAELVSIDRSDISIEPT